MTHAEIITALAKADPAMVRVEWRIVSDDGHFIGYPHATREGAVSMGWIGGRVVRYLVVEAPEA